MPGFTSVHMGIPLRELPVPGKTLPEIFLKQVVKYGSNRAALRYKENDEWKEYSWRDYFNNAVLASFETIKYFRILPNDFAVDTGELTPTLKVKRRVINEKYKDIIDSMYL